MSRNNEARRDLARLAAKHEKLFRPSISAAANDNAGNPMKMLGKRIRRIWGPLITSGLVLYLLFNYFSWS